MRADSLIVFLTPENFKQRHVWKEAPHCSLAEDNETFTLTVAMQASVLQ